MPLDDETLFGGEGDDLVETAPGRAPIDDTTPVPPAPAGPTGGGNKAALGSLAGMVENALGQGVPRDRIAQQMIDSAAKTRDQYARKALIDLGTALISGSNNNISAMLSKMKPGSAGVGSDVVDPLGAAVADSTLTNQLGEDAARGYDDQLAAYEQGKQEEDEALKLQKTGLLSDQALANTSFTDDDGNRVSMADLQKQDPELYNQVKNHLINATPEQLNQFLQDTNFQGLPPQMFGLQGTGAPDWQNPIVKNEAQRQSFLTGLTPNERAAVGEMGWAQINNFLSKGQVPNPHFGQNGDTRQFVNLKAPSEGLGRTAGFSNNLIGSQLLENAIAQTWEPAGEADINRWNVTLQSLPTADQKVIRSAHSMINLLNAAGITGLAGVETLTEYLDKNAASPDILENSTNLRQYYALVIENVADIAYGNLDKNTPLAPQVAFIKKYGGEAFLDNIVQGSANGKITILNGRYYTQDNSGGWVDLGPAQ